MVRSDFDLAWKDDILSGHCAFESDVALKRAVLYRNDIPVTSFTRDGKTILPVFFNGQHAVELTIQDGRIESAVKSFETNGAPNFVWTENKIVSRQTPGWMRMTAGSKQKQKQYSH